MNEDIKILREALAELDSALKNTGFGSSLSHDMEVLRSRRDASRELAELCTADRIRRILDDAERRELAFEILLDQELLCSWHVSDALQEAGFRLGGKKS